MLALCTALVCGTGLANTRPPAYVTELIGENQFVGSGTLRWFGLRIYKAQLWAAGEVPPQVQAGKGVALVLTYFRSLRGRLIADRSKKELAQLDMSSEQTRARWHDQMRAIFPDVNNGDRLAGIIDRNGSTRFFHNGKPIGVVEDPDFGPAFFSIWLDERTSAPGLRAQLLGLNESGTDRSDQSDDSNQ